jgi:iron(III) transport system ATP-binding protein
MRLGAIEQVGSPREVYRHPATEFAAAFLGSANILAASIVAARGDGGYRVRWDGGELEAGGPARLAGDRVVTLVLRPEEIEVAASGVDGDGDGWIDGTLLDIQEAASTVRLRIAVRGLQLLAERSASDVSAFAVGAPVAVRVTPGSGWLVDGAPTGTGIAQLGSDEPARSGHSA